MPDIKQIPLSSFEFLRLLKNNNERNWFNDHKMAYQKELGYIESFAQQLLDLMNTHDVIETASGKKVYTGFIGIRVFQMIKRPTKHIGAEVLNVLANKGEVAIISISNQAIALWQVAFSGLRRKI